MKVGDLVRHQFDGRWDEVGVVLDIRRITPTTRRGCVQVMWSLRSGRSNVGYTSMRDLEVIDESK